MLFAASISSKSYCYFITFFPFTAQFTDSVGKDLLWYSVECIGKSEKHFHLKSEYIGGKISLEGIK